jgi:hypothetical protein
MLWRANTAALLTMDDHCRRAAFYAHRYMPLSLSPKQILEQAIDVGLMSDEDDFPKVAQDYAMQMCVDNVIDSSEQNLLALAEHIAGLAEMITWMARTSGPWERPEPRRIGKGTLWTSGAFLSADEAKLRHLVCVDRWDAMREMELRTSWQVAGECAAYQVPMDIIVFVIGSMRKGRWSNPFTTGWRHPVAKVLRFKKRDGEAFGATWERVWRETDRADRDEWIDSMTEDGALAECVHALTVDVPDRTEETVSLSVAKLERIAAQELPEPQPSRCFDRLRPCPFRSCCPQGKTPDEVGFSTSPEWRDRD